MDFSLDPAGATAARPTDGTCAALPPHLGDARAPAAASYRTLNLALQGGGAHGAFTWGVLDRLLEDGRLRFHTLSGASAGAVNAVAVADGLARGGGAGARETLDAVWGDIAAALDPTAVPGGPFGAWPVPAAYASMQRIALGALTRALSPYQFNPLDVNPLRDLLRRRIDFSRLGKRSPVALVIAATDVATGRARLFGTAEVTLEAVLASACLPHLFRAVEIEGRHYWDGGYSANPPIVALIERAAARDTLIVQLRGGVDPRVPRHAEDIEARAQHVVFGQPLRHEIDRIVAMRRATLGAKFRFWRRDRPSTHRFHLIDAGPAILESGDHDSRAASGDHLLRLRAAGRAAAAEWLDRHFRDIGRRETADLERGGF